MPATLISPKHLCFLLLGLVLFGGSISSGIAASISVMAVVNGKPITSLDFEERRQFLVKTTGIKDTPETSRQIDMDVLQMLVDDVIKTEEGLRLGRGLEMNARSRAREIVNMSFAQHGEDPDKVMQRLGISRQFAEKKFLADVLWASTVQSRFSAEFANTVEEAEKELERVKSNALKPQINLDEIVLVPEPNRNYGQTMKVARQMVDAIRSGADFSRIAQQYSVSGSSQQGGNIGWMLLERLPDDIRSTVENLPSGVITNPVEIDGAIVIYRVNGLRLNGNADPLESDVKVGRLVLPVAETATTSRQAAAEKVTQDIAGIRSCADLNALHNSYGSGLNFDFGRYTMRDFSPQLQKVLLPLNENEFSDPINFSEGVVVFMICEKIIPQLVLPSIEELEQTIRNKHFAVLSARYLSQLRRKAIIEYKVDL